MNRLIFFLMMTFCALGSGLAQIPYGINYQAVARNANGDAMVATSLDVRFTILAGSANGTVEWQETHSVTTNKIGLFNLVIGQGEKVAGKDNFKDISWKSGAHYLKVEIKFAGGDYQQIGEPQLLLWVPYALYAETAGNGSGGTTDAVQNITLVGNTLVISKDGSESQIDFTKYLDNTDQQTLSLDGYKLSISNGNHITLPIPEYQNLSVSGTTLSISNGNSVTVDTDPANELQTLTLEGNQLKILRPGSTQADGSVTLPDLYLENDSVYIKGYTKPNKISLKNELTIPKPNNLKISRGNTVIVDTDTTNEIQDLKLTGDVLKITKNVSATGVDLSPYKDNTDAQQLTLDENAKTLSISGGNSIGVSNLVNVPWVGFSCFNNSGMSISGLSEITISWSKDFDDGNSISGNMFSAAASGVYSFSFATTFTSSDDNIAVRIYKGTNVYRSYDRISKFFSTSTIIKLNAGETISVAIYNGTGYPINLVSAYFSGYRVH